MSRPTNHESSRAAVTQAPSTRVLLVDDDTGVVRSLATALEFEVEIVTCNSGDDALTLLRDGSFDVVCSAYSMPGMNGLELFERVARLSVPVACLLLTGASTFIGRYGSVNHYVLTKPVDPTRLSRLLVQIAHTAEMKRFATRSRAEPRR